MKITWSTNAKQDIKSIYDYIFTDSPSTADKIITKITDTISHIASFPDIGKTIPLDIEQSENYQQIVVEYWSIIYLSESNNIKIITIIDTRRDLKDILKEKLTPKF